MEEFRFIRFVDYFLENPYGEVYLREISKKLKLSVGATKRYADVLVKEQVLVESKRANLRYLRANTENLFYKNLKKSKSVKKILDSEILESIINESINVSSIVLFGSTSKGEDSPESDIDLLVIGKKREFSEKGFEKKIKKEIQIHFFEWKEWRKKFKEDESFYYEVINQGIPLYGELPLIK